MTRRALRFNVVLDDVSITHVAFSPEFTHAVEAKQVCPCFSFTRRFLSRQFLSRWRNKRRSGPRSSLIRPFRKNRCARNFFLPKIVPDKPLFHSFSPLSCELRVKHEPPNSSERRSARIRASFNYEGLRLLAISRIFSRPLATV